MEETIYFNDEIHHDWTIISLKLSQDENHHYKNIVRKTMNEKVRGIAFDPVESFLYWTDSENAIIYQKNLKNDEKPTILIQLNKGQSPQAIAIDICHRRLYWINNRIDDGYSIDSIFLNGSDSKVLISHDLYSPHGIVVDQYTGQIFWTDDKPGEHYTIESANLDGSNPNVVVKGLFHVPYAVAVDERNVYWTDHQGMAVWSVPKKNPTQPNKVTEFMEKEPNGIVVREHLLSAQFKECKSVVDLLKTSYEIETTTGLSSKHLAYQYYCVQGTFSFSEAGAPQCECHEGFDGDRCEINMCYDYCLNGGNCAIKNGVRSCQCPTSFYGHRCEQMENEDQEAKCQHFCKKTDGDHSNSDLSTLCKK